MKTDIEIGKDYMLISDLENNKRYTMNNYMHDHTEYFSVFGRYVNNLIGKKLTAERINFPSGKARTCIRFSYGTLNYSGTKYIAYIDLPDSIVEEYNEKAIAGNVFWRKVREWNNNIRYRR